MLQKLLQVKKDTHITLYYDTSLKNRVDNECPSFINS